MTGLAIIYRRVRSYVGAPVADVAVQWTDGKVEHAVIQRGAEGWHEVHGEPRVEQAHHAILLAFATGKTRCDVAA